uniref:Uncharacterized protein n=1 Tax=Pararge aegeria TaxID=116150 RepID=S4PXD5_9NEOP
MVYWLNACYSMLAPKIQRLVNEIDITIKNHLKLASFLPQIVCKHVYLPYYYNKKLFTVQMNIILLSKFSPTNVAFHSCLLYYIRQLMFLMYFSVNPPRNCNLCHVVTRKKGDEYYGAITVVWHDGCLAEHMLLM